MAQTWKAVPGYPDIQISDDLQFRTIERVVAYVRPSGTVSHRKFPAKKLTVLWLHKAGYATVFVSRLRRPVGCHVLVCLAWHGLPPEGKPMALHRDGDESNFTPENLYWGDSKDNAEDARRHGTLATGDRHGSNTHPEKFSFRQVGPNIRKLSTAEAAFIRQVYAPRDPEFGGKPLSLKFGVDPATIRKIVKQTTYKEI